MKNKRVIKPIYKWWNDQKFVAELDKISTDLKSRRGKGFSLEESKSELLTRLKKNG